MTKGYSPILDCEVWRLQQEAHGKWFQITFAIFTVDLYDEYRRRFVAMRVWEHRRALRFAIANHQEEQASVRT
jgi:hypothetical protein